MVLDNELDKPPQEVLGLVVRQPVDALHVVAHGEDGLPAGYGVRADNRVDRLEGVAHVLGGAARLGEELEIVALRGIVESRLGVVRCQGV